MGVLCTQMSVHGEVMSWLEAVGGTGKTAIWDLKGCHVPIFYPDRE
jgi:hypothetical protein